MTLDANDPCPACAGAGVVRTSGCARCCAPFSECLCGDPLLFDAHDCRACGGSGKAIDVTKEAASG